MMHNWDLYFDTSSEYWGKIQKIYEENEKYPKKIVKGRNLHHKFMKSFSRLEKSKVDNDNDNLVSLDLADHYLVHYYLWKCTKTGFRNRTAMAFRLMNSRMQKYVNDETVELLAQEYKNVKKDLTVSEETRKKLSDAMKGNKRALGSKRPDLSARNRLGKGKKRGSYELSEKGKFNLKYSDSKPVMCIETKRIWWSTADAVRETGISMISSACTGRQKTAGGYHWCYMFEVLDRMKEFSNE